MLRSLGRSLALLAPLAASLGCGSENEFTADMAGVYTLALTSRASTCPFPNWREGESATNIGFTVAQSGADVHATVDGLVGAFVALALGTNQFDGTISGSDFSLTNYGTNPQTQGNCTFTYNAVAAGKLQGDAISGTITYSPATNDNPDCRNIQCSAVQDFSGTRAPR